MLRNLNTKYDILEIKKPARNLKFKDYYANYKNFLRVISVEELKEKY